jgi:hypothetical protein
MTTPLQKVQALIARAIDEGATLDEQRNSALAAVKLMTKHKLSVTDRPPLPVIDISPDDLINQARGAAADGVEEIADVFRKQGLQGVVDWFQNEAPIIKPHRTMVAKRNCTCANCFAQISIGQRAVVELMEGGGKRRVTCTKEKCVASWTHL